MIKSRLSRIVEIILYAVLVVIVAVFLSSPFIMERFLLWMQDGFAKDPVYIKVMLGFSMAVCFGAIWIVAELIAMFRTIRQNPFSKRNVRALKRMGIMSLILAVLFLIKSILYLTPMTVLCTGVMTLCGLFAAVLSRVFAQAVEYKEENDLTI